MLGLSGSDGIPGRQGIRGPKGNNRDIFLIKNYYYTGKIFY